MVYLWTAYLMYMLTASYVTT